MIDKDYDRWSDEKLDAFHKEFGAKVEEGEKLFATLQAQNRLNTEAIRRIEENTIGLLTLWSEGRSVIRVGATLGRFAKWLTTVAVIGVIIQWLIDHSH